VQYDEPPRLDFLEAVLIGDQSPEAAKLFLASLNKGLQAPDMQSALRVFKGRPKKSLMASYGQEFTETLEKSSIGEWQAIKSMAGLHFVKLEGKTNGEPTTYDAVKDKVYLDWKDQTLQLLRTKAVRDLGQKYKVQFQQAQP
jgi:hypothetical protein